MNAFKKATKRITAVAASAAMVSSAVFGAGLSNYPGNFDNSGVTVVVGSTAAAADTTSAQSIIDALTTDGTTSYVVTATKTSSASGESISAVKSNKQLNYGETLGTETETAGFDDQNAEVLEDGRFDNDISDEDYTQTLTLSNGAFNYALRDEVEGVDEITDGLFYSNGQSFATYVLEFDNSIDLSASDFDEDLIGKDLVIMGNEFTIGEVTADGSDDLDKLVLLGGSNKIALGEGESNTVTIDGKEYEVSVQSVSTTKVLLTVNGVSSSIDEFDTEEVGGVNIAVTDLVDSSRDSVKGYAELVVGGQKVTLEAGAIQINDEDLDDTYEEYDVDVAFSGTGMQTITITYSVEDDTLLQTGDSLNDVLFDSFSLVYEGTNEPEYTELQITTTKEEIQFDGTMENGEAIPAEFKLYYSTEGSSGGDLYLGDEDYRIFYESNNSVVYNADGVLSNSSHLTFNTANVNIKDYGFFYAQDLDEQFLYVISNVDNDNLEVDFDELIEGKSNAEVDVNSGEWDSELEDGSNYVVGNTSGVVRVDKTDLNNPILTLEGYLLLNIADAEDTALTSTPDASLVIRLDNTESGVDGDDTEEESDQFTLSLGFPSDADDSLDVQVVEASSDEVNSGSLADAVDGDDDTRVYVTQYGIMATVDNDEYDSVTIAVPDEQVYGKVSLVFGDASEMSTMTESFASEDEANERADELEEDGYTVTVKESTSEAVDFEVSAVTLDSDVTGNEDLIVVGGPAVNSVAADLLGLSFPSSGTASGLAEGEAVIRFFEDENSVLVYGWSAEDTAAAAARLNAGGLSGNEVDA